PAPQRLRGRFTLPQLDTGNYLLETALADGSATAPRLQVYVLGAELARDDAPAWTDVRRLLAGELERPGRRRLKRLQSQKEAVAALTAAYRDSLQRLASGATGEALELLEATEVAAVEDDAAAAPGLLAAAQGGVIADLAERDPECLVPLLMLHLELHDRYVEARRFPLAAFARDRIVDLAERYARNATSERAPVLASEALADLGAYLLHAQLRNPGRNMLERALQLDERNVFARLDLAVALERFGEYRPAVAALRRLTELDPELGEARLRLAINLARIGERAESERQLRRLIAGGADDWLLAIAYQELARHYLAEARLEAAVSLLDESIHRLPQEGRLYLLLAYALDRSGRAGRGREILDAAPLATREASPRNRYNRRLAGDRTLARRALRRGSLARLPALALALGGGRPG
ncbi:MAG: tetratricopeptide repeat protein, partial [Acidobacteria bacterium]